MNINVASTSAAAGGSAELGGPIGFKVDLSRGERVGRVSSEWFSRPDDERFLSLPDLYATVRARAERATARTLESRAIRVEARRADPERLELIVPGREAPVLPTHWSFGQLCSLVGAPASYLRDLPAPLAGVSLQHGLLSHRAELIKTLEAEEGILELRAVTGPDMRQDLVCAVCTCLRVEIHCGRAFESAPTSQQAFAIFAAYRRACSGSGRPSTFVPLALTAPPCGRRQAAQG